MVEWEPEPHRRGGQRRCGFNLFLPERGGRKKKKVGETNKAGIKTSKTGPVSTKRTRKVSHGSSSERGLVRLQVNPMEKRNGEGEGKVGGRNFGRNEGEAGRALFRG